MQPEPRRWGGPDLRTVERSARGTGRTGIVAAGSNQAQELSTINPEFVVDAGTDTSVRFAHTRCRDVCHWPMPNAVLVTAPASRRGLTAPWGPP